MAKFTDLAEITTPANGDILAIVQISGNTSKKITRANFLGGAALPNNTVTTPAITDGSVTPAKLLAGTGTTHTWQTWALAWANLTAGNGVLSYAKYTQIGKTVHFRIKFIVGSTTTVGSGPTFSLPVAANGDYGSGQLMNALAHYYDTSVPATQFGQIKFAGPTTGILLFVNGSLATQSVSGAGPFGWATGDEIQIAGTYEAA